MRRNTALTIPSALEHRVKSGGAHEDHDGPASVMVVDVHLSNRRCGIVAAPVHAPWPADICHGCTTSCKRHRQAHAASVSVGQHAEWSLPGSDLAERLLFRHESKG